jgi:ABC-2 type transport system ATP-binding protein
MDNAIEFRAVEKAYSAFKLGPLNLTVPRGAIYGLIGPNGAGKTTAIDLIFGMGVADAGQIRVLDCDHRADEAALKMRAAYVGPEMNFQVWGTVGKAIRFIRGFYPSWDDAYCASLMESFRLGAQEKIVALSLGAKTKLSLLMALSRRPEVLILDEPTTGLDAVSRQQVFGELLKAVEDGNKSILISSHGLSDIERFADRVGIINKGKMLLEGRTDEMVERFRFAEFFCDAGANFRGCDGLTIVKRSDNRWRVLLDMQSAAQLWLEKQGARQLTLTAVTLEELFIALVTGLEAK